MNDTFKYHDAEQQEHMCIALAKACLQTHVGSLHIRTCLGCQIPHIRTTNRGTHVSCSAYEQGLGPLPDNRCIGHLM